MNRSIIPVLHKCASLDPRLSGGLQGAAIGAAGGVGLQLLRRLFQSDEDEAENGSPSLLNGLLYGGLLGGGAGAGLGYLAMPGEHALQSHEIPHQGAGWEPPSAAALRDWKNPRLQAMLRTPESSWTAQGPESLRQVLQVAPSHPPFRNARNY